MKKVIFLVLALAVVALAAPAEDDKKPGKNGKNGESEYDGNVKFDLFGDGSLKAKLDSLIKPIQEFFGIAGFNGNVKGEGDAKGGAHIIGNFRFNGKRNGNGNGKLDAQSSGNSESSPSDDAASGLRGSRSIRN